MIRRWLQARALRRAADSGRYDCPLCGGWAETGMPFPHAARIHLTEYCPEIHTRADAGAEVVKAIRAVERATGRQLLIRP